MISVDLAAIERSADREHHKAIDEVDDDPRRGTLGLLAAHGGRVPRACREGRPEAPDTPTAASAFRGRCCVSLGANFLFVFGGRWA